MRYGSKLLDVLRPGRYEGVETGAVVKPWEESKVRIALAFPDVYEIGMSHLGYAILYDILNNLDGVAAERAYAPWPDMEALLGRESLPLVTRESGQPLSSFDLVGFTLQYELCATNVLTMLHLGGIPLLASERFDGMPIVLGGGPVAANPEPYADFFDAFYIGEGEEGISEIAQALLKAKEEGLNRADTLKALGEIEGIYLPASVRPLYEGGRFAGFEPVEGETLPLVRRRVVDDLNRFPPPRRPVMPFGETVHDRLAVEVARGCTRGCRFCQAGYLYRPVREREPDELLASIADTLQHTGHEEVGLLSLSTGDYSCIGPLIVSLMEAHAESHVSVSLPSLRIDGLDPRLATEIAKVRKSGFTLAPEAGSERLRRAINKDFSDEAIIATVRRIFEAGWKGVKLYFMVGLPTETPEDHDALVRLTRRIAGAAPGGKSRITVSVSNFVPKPHTPFQWARQANRNELSSAHDLLRKEVPGKKAELKYHDSTVSIMEGVFARGDRRLGKVIRLAWEKGCRMDGWSSEFRAALWEEALAEEGLGTEEYLRERGTDEPLPWDLVDIGVDREYLLAELQKAHATEPTGDCRREGCTGCGLCDFETLKPLKAKVELTYPVPVEVAAVEPEQHEIIGDKLRFVFSKTGPAALLSHLESSRILLRAFRAAGVEPVYSRGFNPHPRMQLGPALSLGTESLSETGEIFVARMPLLTDAVEKINGVLPEGLKVLCLWHMKPESRTLTGGGMEEEYLVTPSSAALKRLREVGGWEALVEKFRETADFTVVKRRKNKPDRPLSAHEYIMGAWPVGEKLGLAVLRMNDGATLSPELFAGALLGLPEEVRALDLVLKTRTHFFI